MPLASVAPPMRALLVPMSAATLPAAASQKTGAPRNGDGRLRKLPDPFKRNFDIRPPDRVEGSDPEQGANLHCLPAEHASGRCHKGDNASRLYEILCHCLIAVRCPLREARAHGRDFAAREQQ